MILRIDAFFRKYLESDRYDLNIVLFLRLFYVWNFFHLVVLSPYFELIFGEMALISNYEFNADSLFDWFSRVLINESFKMFAIYFFVGAILCLLYLLTFPKSFFVLLIYYFFIINLQNKAYVILDGGNNLQELLLIYSLIMTFGFLLKNNFLGQTLRNSGLFLARMQLCFLYLTACLSKFTGEMWQKGVALYYSLSLNSYSNPYLAEIILSNDFLLVVGNYYTLAFQLSFPFLIWNFRTRNVIILMGVLLHTMIAFVMGLFFFGLVMIVSYALFSNHLPLAWYVSKKSGWRRIVENCSLVLLPRELFRFVVLKLKNREAHFYI